MEVRGYGLKLYTLDMRQNNHSYNYIAIDTKILYELLGPFSVWTQALCLEPFPFPEA